VSPTAPPPTETELAVLRVLWERGPATVQEVHDDLYGGTDIGYTTSLKVLQNMLTKRLVKRDATRKQHVYEAAVGEDDTLSRHIRRMIDRTFKGSAVELAMRALESRPVSTSELAELKRLIRTLERERPDA
jgi:predicted transcriptional regulator